MSYKDALFDKAKTKFDTFKSYVEQIKVDVKERINEPALKPDEISHLKRTLFKKSSFEGISQLRPVSQDVTEKNKSLYWGMTMEQFDTFITTCMNTYTYRWIKENSIHEKKRWYNPSTNKIERIKTVNAYDIDKYFTKPLTEKTGMGVALNMQEGEGIKAEVMLSHAWGEDIEHILYLLRSFKGQPLANGKVFGNDTVLWFCAFAQYQNEDAGSGPTVAEQVALNNFLTVINNVKDVIALHTTADDMYSRMWCVEELRCAAEFGKCVHFLATPDYVLRYTSDGRDNDLRVSSQRDLLERSDPKKTVAPLSLYVDCENAQGTGIKEITENIKNTIGFKYLNLYVYYLRQLLLQGYLNAMTRKAAVEEPAKVSVFLPLPTKDNIEKIERKFPDFTIKWTPKGEIDGDDLETMPSIFLGFNQKEEMVKQKGIYISEGEVNPVTKVRRVDTTHASDSTTADEDYDATQEEGIPRPTSGAKKVRRVDTTHASDSTTADEDYDATQEEGIPRPTSGAKGLKNQMEKKSIDLRLGSHQQQYSPRDGSTAEIVDALNGVQDAVSELTQVISNLQRALAVNTPARPTTRENSNRNNSNRDVNTERWV